MYVPYLPLCSIIEYIFTFDEDSFPLSSLNGVAHPPLPVFRGLGKQDSRLQKARSD